MSALCLNRFLSIILLLSLEIQLQISPQCNFQTLLTSTKPWSSLVHLSIHSHFPSPSPSCPSEIRYSLPWLLLPGLSSNGCLQSLNCLNEKESCMLILAGGGVCLPGYTLEEKQQGCYKTEFGRNWGEQGVLGSAVSYLSGRAVWTPYPRPWGVEWVNISVDLSVFTCCWVIFAIWDCCTQSFGDTQ